MELFSLTIPPLLVIAAIAAGAAAITGEEDRGTLELLFSLPISRPRIALEKFLALVVESTAPGFVVWLSLWLGARAVGMDIAATKIAAATASAVALAFAYSAIALLVGCVTGRHGLAIRLTAAAAIAAYLVNSLAPLVSALEPVQKAPPSTTTPSTSRYTQDSRPRTSCSWSRLRQPPPGLLRWRYSGASWRSSRSSWCTARVKPMQLARRERPADRHTRANPRFKTATARRPTVLAPARPRQATSRRTATGRTTDRR